MDAAEKRRPGRPRIGEGGRAGDFVGFRCPTEVKAKLERAAAANGRSVSLETQVRITRSLDVAETLAEAQQLTQNQMYGPKGAELLRLIGRVLRHAPGAVAMDVEDDWVSDPTAYSIVEREITHLLMRLRPDGMPSETAGESPENRVDRLLVALGKIAPPIEWATEDGQ